MSINFPVSLDSFDNPEPGTSMDVGTILHDVQHANVNDAIEALETKVGIDITPAVGSLAYLLTSPDSDDPGHLHTIYGVLAGSNIWTETQKININSATAFLVEQTGVKSNCFVVDTANAQSLIQKDALNCANVYAARNYDSDVGLLLSDTTVATSGNVKFPPWIKFRGHSWNGSIDVTMDFVLGFKTRTDSASGFFTLGVRSGVSGNYTEFFSIATSGNFTTKFSFYANNYGAVGQGVNLNTGSSAATVFFSPSVHLHGSANSRAFSADILNAPEISGSDEVGKFLFCFGVNSSSAASTNELCRMEFGDRRRVVFNSLLADQDFIVSGDTVANCFVVDAGFDNITINAAAISVNYDLMLAGDGVLGLKETATPTADTNYGKIYCKDTNKLFFQDGAGVEHEIAFV